jgi:hypothetical protein
LIRKACGSKKPQGFLNFNITDRENFFVSRGVLQPADLSLDRPYSSGHLQQENCVMLLRLGFDQCCEIVGRARQLSPSLPWHRLFSERQRLTFCANRSDIDGGLRNTE